MKNQEAAVAAIHSFILGQAITLCMPKDHEDFTQVWQGQVTVHL